MSVIKLNDENFSKEVLEYDGTVLVDFWASWCGPCKMLSPIVDEVAEEVSNVKFCKLNVDEARETASKYNIMSIPTLIVFKNGKTIRDSVGLISKDKIMGLLK